ncbi:MAG: Ribonuclease 3 [Candidatus Heimdallarchaeota archaeon LC_3]|nr:MAG: Ribonuclease 3 [Candidatus Heimdallarchaeota archaeon LC_3]
MLIEQSYEEVTLRELTESRSKLETNDYMSKIFDKLRISEHVITEKEKIPFDHHWKATIIEAILGAVYFDGGIEVVRKIVAGWKPKTIIKEKN